MLSLDMPPLPPVVMENPALAEIQSDQTSVVTMHRDTDETDSYLIVQIDGEELSQTEKKYPFPSISIVLVALNDGKVNRLVSCLSSAECKLRQELNSYRNLVDNWDGEGARAPSSEAIDDALSFLDRRPGDIPIPYPEEGNDGDVGVYWDNRDAQVFAEVVFEGDTTYAYFAVHGEPGAVIKKCGEDGKSVTDQWPKDMVQILQKINSN